MRSGAVVFVMMMVAMISFFLASESAAEPELGIALPSDVIAAEIITEAEEVMLKRKQDKMQHPIGEAEWPCCSECGICNLKEPQECQCLDLRVGGCHPSCNKCLPSGIVFPTEPPRYLYYCADWISAEFCTRKCTD